MTNPISNILTRTSLATVAAVAAFATLIPHPVSAADAAQGSRLAQRWCSSCHATSSGQARAMADAPSFASISSSRKVSEIRAFLLQPHPQMPDMALSRDEISDLIAHIQALAPPLDPLTPENQKDIPPKAFRG